MTSSTVNLRGVASVGNFPVPAPKVQGAADGTDFGQVLENTTSRSNVQDTNVETAKDNQPVEDKAPVEEVQETETADKPDTGETKDETIGITDEQKPGNVAIPEADVEEAMVILQTSILEIQDLFCETLGVSKEELTTALDALGMTELDLLIPGNETKLVLQLEGQNELALLTDEDLYNTVQNLEVALSQISEELNQNMISISQEDAPILMEQAVKAMEETTVSNEAPVIEVSGDVSTLQSVVNVSEEGQSSEKEAGEEKQPDSHVFTGNQVVNNNFQQNIMELESGDRVFDMEQTRIIMDQIMEHMELNLDADDTTLQMQLHPEELGNLQVTISAKEGVMTAHFVAESDAVKTVLENQLIQLQDKFDQQNIKVEAIEISVATHGFEQNLQQDDQKGGYQEEEKTQRVRKIDLSNLDAIEELPEEDQVVADMMQLHGNRVDYMA